MAFRRCSWADQRFTVAALVAGTFQAFNLLDNAPVSDTLTVTRIIGDFRVMYSPNSTVVDSLSVVDIGIGVGSAHAVSAGEMPDPTVDSDYPPRGWLYVATQAVS